MANIKLVVSNIKENIFTSKDGVEQTNFIISLWNEKEEKSYKGTCVANRANLDKFETLKNKEVEVDEKSIYTKKVNKDGKSITFKSLLTPAMVSLGFEAKSKLENLKEKY